MVAHFSILVLHISLKCSIIAAFDWNYFNSGLSIKVNKKLPYMYFGPFLPLSALDNTFPSLIADACTKTKIRLSC